MNRCWWRYATHASTTDPQAPLYRKSHASEARLAYLGHLLMENGHGLVVDVSVSCVTGTAKREAALQMIIEPSGTTGFVQGIRERAVTPHVARNAKRPVGSTLDGRTTRHPGSAVNQRKRRRTEDIFGWPKTFGLIRQVKLPGLERIIPFFTLHTAPYNLLRVRKLIYRPAQVSPAALPGSS